MKSIGDLPTGLALPPIQGLISGRPTSWQGMTVEWSSNRDPEPVFVGRFALPLPVEAPIYFFGARYDLSEALVGGESLGEGHFLEFFIAEESPETGWRLRRLLQHQSVTYSEEDEKGDYLPARDVDARSYSADAPPRWKPTEALWPTHTGSPMTFLGQVELPDTDVTRTLLTWDINLYLFWTYANGASRFKVVQQETRFQTAAEHYATEQ